MASVPQKSKSDNGKHAPGVNLDRLLQVNVATVAAFATLLLGIGQQDARFPILAVTAAIGSVILTDTLRWLVLNRFYANIGAVAAAVYSLHTFFETTGARQLFAIANLLVYLQMILLFQKKDARIYWQLLVLSLLQVVVAAALNMDVTAGIFLLLYTVAAVSALMLFFIHRESGRLSRPEQSATPPANLRMRKRRANRRRESKDVPLAEPVVQRASLARQLVSRRLGWQVAAIGLASLLLAVFLFFSTPRRGQNVWQGPPGFTPSESGFSGDINLNRSSRLQLSDQVVMRVAFQDLETGRPYTFQGEPYFRGSVLVHYRNGRWTSRDFEFRRIRIQLPPLPRSTAGLVRQDTVVEAGADTAVFAVAPAFGLDDSPLELTFDPRSRQLSRKVEKEELLRRQFHFSVATSGFHDGRLTPATPPDLLPVAAERAEWLQQREQDFTANFDPFQHSGIQTRAEHVLRFAGITKDRDNIPTDAVAAARALEDYFTRSGLYRYTLDLASIERSGDPIEDFVLRNRAGHCEFFASALALMLRSQGIRSRVVVGFKGGVFNPVGDYFRVRKRDAHAWVEAFIPASQVTANMLAPNHAAQDGAWLRLDPTPASGDETDPTQTDHVVDYPTQTDHVVDYMQNIWDDYVLGLGQHPQHGSLLSSFSDDDPLRFSYQGWSKVPAADWRWPLIVVSLGLLMVAGYKVATSRKAAKLRAAIRIAVYRLAKRFSPKLAAIIAPAEQQSARRVPHVAFYQQLVDLLSRHNITRISNQTQREFARVVRDHLSRPDNDSEVVAIPEQIVEAFYRVRFGEHSLTGVESEWIVQALAQLEAALSSEAPVRLS